MPYGEKPPKKNCSLPVVILILQFGYDYVGSTSPQCECRAQCVYLELCNISAVLVAECPGYFTCYCHTRVVQIYDFSSATFSACMLGYFGISIMIIH